jgi:hypothetical protein
MIADARLRNDLWYELDKAIVASPLDTPHSQNTFLCLIARPGFDFNTEPKIWKLDEGIGRYQSIGSQKGC